MEKCVQNKVNAAVMHNGEPRGQTGVGLEGEMWANDVRRYTPANKLWPDDENDTH
jgi:hypothetical protein